MASLEIVRSGSGELVVQELPDGSTAIFETATKNVYSLNRSAAAAWEACASPTSLPGLAAAMSRRLNAPVTEELAREAVSELVAAGLVSVSPAERLETSRRDLLKQAAGVAIPVVLVLTGAEQRAHAQGTGSEPLTTTSGPTTSGPTTSGPTTIAPTTSAPTTTLAPLNSVTLTLIKGFGISLENSTTPLVGATFDVHLNTVTGPVVAQLVTDGDGKASVQLPPGTYWLVETSAPAPPGPFLPLDPIQVVLTPNQDTSRNVHNILPS